MRDGRAALAAGDIARRSQAACERVVALPAFEHADRVVAYVARDHEIDPMLVVAVARRAGKRVYYPGSDGDFRLDGGPERDARTAATGEPLPPDSGDVLIVVPGVAFDERGARLGRGAGWYDRALTRHRRGTRIGFAYDFQVVPEVPEEHWDVRMHAVATETRLLGALASGAVVNKEIS